jgi:hypothetical protein
VRLAVALALSALVLAGCGADGAPQPPTAKRPVVTVTGEARTGVVFGG